MTFCNPRRDSFENNRAFESSVRWEKSAKSHPKTVSTEMCVCFIFFNRKKSYSLEKLYKVHMRQLNKTTENSNIINSQFFHFICHHFKFDLTQIEIKQNLHLLIQI